MAAWYDELGLVRVALLRRAAPALFFPDGRLLSPRWRIVLAVDLAALVLSVIGEAFRPGALDIDAARTIENPFGAARALSGVVLVIAGLGGACIFAGLALGTLSFVLRLRRSRGRERQQLKLFAVVVVTWRPPSSCSSRRLRWPP